MPDISPNYPGQSATTVQILALAEEYRKGAGHLMALGRPRVLMSWAPFRLLAIHAIELFFNALLLDKGHSASAIRGLQHDLAKRTDLVTAAGLRLRKKTVAHLTDMVGNREYLVTRYGPELTTSVSQINRLKATLDEVAIKVTILIKPSTGANSGSSSPPSRP